MTTSTSRFSLANTIAVFTLLLASFVTTAAVSSASLPCAEEFQVIETFDNGAAWEMCRVNNNRENLILTDISYKPPDGEFYRIMGSMRLSQLHVTYDDSNVTYNDVTQYGLGDEFMTTLLTEDCPNGELLPVSDRPGICLSRQGGDGTQAADQFRSGVENAIALSFTLTSISQVGSYTYLVSWQFFADGSMLPSVGAAGALQRSAEETTSPFGRQLEGSADKSWLSHTHNYYWRLDFDLGEHADDDHVLERTVFSDASGQRRQQQTQLQTEAAKETAPDIFRSWEIVDGSGVNGGSQVEAAQQIAYSLEPINQGHKHVRAEREPYTQFDFFVTKQNDCERFASQNTRFNPGCADDVLGFVNNESIVDTDIVVWHRVSFHHIPRNEDQAIMHSHWDGFTLRPRYLHATTPGHSGVAHNHPPVFAELLDRQHDVNTAVSVPLDVSDVDGDQLVFTANGLPSGITLNDNAVLSGKPTTQGQFKVTLSASDGIAESRSSFQWTISTKKRSGAVSSTELTVLALLCVLSLIRLATRPDSSLT